MGVYLGIDIGTVSIKIALLTDDLIDGKTASHARDSNLFVDLIGTPASSDKISANLLVTEYKRIKGNPIEATNILLSQILEIFSPEQISGIRVCGSGGKLIGDLLKVPSENEFRAIAYGVGELYPEISTVFEMGGQNSKFISLERDKHSETTGISDYEKSGDCAAGTGSFLDQQASRLKINVTEIGDIVSDTTRSAKIAGRCSVFAKSDMIHAQQKGFTPAEVLRGLCEAVARNFKSSIVKGKKIKIPVLFIGGVAVNRAIVSAMTEIFKLEIDDIVVPKYYAWIPAIGTALAARESSQKFGLENVNALKNYVQINKKNFPVSQPLSMEKVILLRDKVHPKQFQACEGKLNAYLGIDIGSVSTNLVVIDEAGNVLKEIYTRTKGRPIEVVDHCLKEIEEELSHLIEIKGVSTTGSGRELIGELIGADSIHDEITAHKTGAEFLAQTILHKKPDTIFEIGGQDSKYISIEDGVVVDFAMNEACAAGTGSFLEERADELDISIKDEFARLALLSTAPIKLGERCTVFMQQDVASYQQKGALKEDLTAGLAYSIVHNYLNRVVRGRKIGEVIFFQGGTAYNDAIASAFTKVLDREVIVPPYNGVVGAVGAALLAREKISATNQDSKFRGFSLERIDYTLREFTCKACTNYCNMQEFIVEGEKTYWGDQCSDKFRRKQSGDKLPIIQDLLSLRRQWLFEGYNPQLKGKEIIGLPRAMYVYEQFPLWNTFFKKLGYSVLLSEESNSQIVKQGTEASLAEPCLPIQAYHGHVQNLIEKSVDWLFIPNMINAATRYKNVNSYYCPWGQTLPFVLKNSPIFEDESAKILMPSIRFRNGFEAVSAVLYEALKPLNVKKNSVKEALQAGYENLENFNRKLLETGRRELEVLNQRDEIGFVLVGRTYNIYDRGLTLNIGNKIRDYYGVNVIPMDFLPVDNIDISDVNANMYWNYGRKIIAAAKYVSDYPNLHIIYLTNFKCGPDSFIKHYITLASGKPFLSLQFDGHSNDAGYITRCEAYLDSKGALRWWSKSKNPDKHQKVWEPV